MSTRQAASAVNRFGLGALPGEIAQAGDPRGWLHGQLRAAPDSGAFAGLPSSLDLLRRETAFRQARRARKRDALSDSGGADETAAMSGNRVDARKRGPGGIDPARRELRQLGVADIAARYRLAATTQRPFVERLVRFWSNHFAVSIDKGQARLYAAPMEREAIRPHVLGNFSDLLLAVETHPAMLRYLDNVVSVGADSMLVERRSRRAGRRTDGKPPRKLGLNENLAREIMELHTLGAESGYTQADVVEFARALTGWGVPLPRELDAARGAFAFHDRAHEPGARRLLGRIYAQQGQEQGRAILRDLARHPATARHLSLKLARHFVADAPTEALVQRLTKAYLASGGDMRTWYSALIDDDAAWSADARKFKTPDDFVVSSMRGGGFGFDRAPELVNLLRELGQPAFMPRSPAGFPDTTGDWAAGDALRKRLQVAGTFGERVAGARTPLQLAQEVLGGDAVSGDFASALRRAGSPQEGYAILFASPAFQWRT